MTIFNYIASFLSGLLGAMGFGGGGVLIIYLTNILKIEQLTAQGINLLFFIPCAVTGLILHIKNKLIDFRQILPFLLTSIPGVITGLLLTEVISGNILSKIFGSALVILGARELFRSDNGK